jgi:FHS family glucose/mannose:H+ symporter-like MFS transporter
MTQMRLDKLPATDVPSAALLHLAMMLTGVATALLGPVLPLISHHWHLQDQQSGLLLLAQFCGAFTGGLTVQKHLRRSVTFGLAAGFIGFMGFALSPSLPFACIWLFLGGWGTGQVITACNIIAARRYAEHRGSALALLNFSWSFGAMLSPLLAAWLTPHFALRTLLCSFAALHALALTGVLIELRAKPAEVVPGSDGGSDAIASGAGGLALRAVLYFAAMLFFYGGVETCLAGWLTTFALRYGDRTLVVSEYTTLVFWASLTIGRGLSSALMLRIGERPLQRAGLIVTAICTVGLATSHGAIAIAAYSIFLGLSLAPFFPATFSVLMGDKPSARQAGTVICMSGLGAAFLPALMGVVSTHSGSLQLALGIPLVASVVLLAMSFFPPLATGAAKSHAAV